MANTIRLMEDVGKRVEQAHGIRVVRRAEEKTVKQLVTAKAELPSGVFFIEEQGFPASLPGRKLQLYIISVVSKKLGW